MRAHDTARADVAAVAFAVLSRAFTLAQSAEALWDLMFGVVCRCGASRLILVAPDEWANGTVRVKDLGTREESDVPIAELVGRQSSQ